MPDERPKFSFSFSDMKTIIVVVFLVGGAWFTLQAGVAHNREMATQNMSRIKTTGAVNKEGRKELMVEIRENRTLIYGIYRLLQKQKR